VADGAYFGIDVSPLVTRLTSERLEDGGWNCERASGSVRSSFDTTINVLDGLREYEQVAGGTPESRAAREPGEEYLRKRGLFRRLSTGEPADEQYLRFAHPNRWHYDILRALDFARTGSRDRAAAIRYAHDHGISLPIYPQPVDKPDTGGRPGADRRSARWSSQSCSSISQPVGTTMARTKKATTTGMAKGDPAGVSIMTGQIPIKAPVVQAMATIAAPLATPGVDSGRPAAAGPRGISAVTPASSA
jgi:hypothetical protein